MGLQDSVDFLAIEYLEDETLPDRLSQEFRQDGHHCHAHLRPTYQQLVRNAIQVVAKKKTHEDAV
jgi:hypothetical protein